MNLSRSTWKKALGATSIVILLTVVAEGLAFGQQYTLLGERLHLFSQDYPTFLIGQVGGSQAMLRKRTDDGTLEFYSSSSRGKSSPFSFLTSGDLSSETLRIDPGIVSVNRRLHVISPEYPTILLGDDIRDWVATIRKRTDNGTLEFYSSSSREQSHAISFFTNGDLSSEALRIERDGALKAKKIVVTLTDWPDEKFNPDYRLTDLLEIESFIKDNRHLPGIPPEHEIEKNGVNLGEMQAKILGTVEELTLHMISLKKELDKLHEENESMKKRLSSLD